MGASGMSAALVDNELQPPCRSNPAMQTRALWHRTLRCTAPHVLPSCTACTAGPGVPGPLRLLACCLGGQGTAGGTPAVSGVCCTRQRLGGARCPAVLHAKALCTWPDLAGPAPRRPPTSSIARLVLYCIVLPFSSAASVRLPACLPPLLPAGGVASLPAHGGTAHGEAGSCRGGPAPRHLCLPQASPAGGAPLPVPDVPHVLCTTCHPLCPRARASPPSLPMHCLAVSAPPAQPY